MKKQRFDATAVFQLELNGRGHWTYGFSRAGGAAYAFIAFDRGQAMPAGDQSWTMSSYNPSGTPAIWRNAGATTRYGVAPGQLALHPGPQRNGDFVILRFTVPVDGVYKIGGRFFAGDVGAMDARVVRNQIFDAPLLAFAVADDSALLALPSLPLSRGDTLDFIVGNRGNFNAGNTPVQVVIEHRVVGFVLGGGGSKGDFQVGALHYLQAAGWKPDVLATTSVGTVNGLKLAEGEDTPEHGLRGLTQLWLALDDYRGFFEEEQWLLAPNSAPAAVLRRFLVDHASLNNPNEERQLAVDNLSFELYDLEMLAIKERLDQLLVAVTNPVITGMFGALAASTVLGPGTSFGLLIGGFMLAPLVAEIAALFDNAATQSSVFNLGPTRRMAEQSLDLPSIARWADAGNQLRIATVGLVSGNVHFIDERGRMSDREGAPFMQGADVDPECGSKLSWVRTLRSQIARLKGAARISDAVAWDLEELRSKLMVAEQELQECVDSHPSSPRPQTVSLIDAMIASSTMPFFFPPVALGTDSYVDGGLREVIPLQSALDLGANTVFAIQASRTRIAVAGTDPVSNLGTVALRSLMDIAIDEVAFSDVRPFLRNSVQDITVIEPRVEIHTTFTIYPAFIRNRISYGFMCAADVVSPPLNPDAAQRCRQIADRIATLRYVCARLECWRSGQPIPPAMVLVRPPVGGVAVITRALTTHKAEIGALVAERTALGGAMPPLDAAWGNAPGWAVGDEVHPWSSREFRDDAELAASGVPDAIAAGGSAVVQIVARNTGSSAWTVAGGYRLVFRPGFGLAEMPVQRDVTAGGSITFDVSLPAPAAPSAEFECQMMQGTAQRFGARSERRTIVLSGPTEPSRCTGIREEIRLARIELSDLEASLTGDPRTDAAIRGAMAGVSRRISGLESEGQGLGCAL